MNTASLLLVHGNGGGTFRFNRCLERFSPAIEVVVAPTLPGFYPEPVDDRLKTFRDYAVSLLPYLADLPRPITALGTGIGGSLLLELLQHHPESIDRLILHAPVGAHLDKRLFPKLLALPGVAKLAQSLIGHPFLQGLWTRLFFEERLPADFLTEFFRGYRCCKVFGQMFRLINEDWWNSLRPLDTPAVIMWGARERLLTVDQKDPFLTLLPQATVEVIEHWRHFPMIEQPLEFAQKVEQHL